MKRVHNKEFCDTVKVYDGVKDSFGNHCLVLVNESLNEIRVVSKNKDYNSKMKQLREMGCNNVIVPRYLQVINLPKKTREELEKEFEGYCHTEWFD